MHKQYAITFKSPSYALNEGSEGKTVLVELVKPSDESTSEPMEFTFLPRGQTTQPPAAPSSVQEKSRQEQKAPQVEGFSSLIDFVSFSSAAGLPQYRGYDLASEEGERGSQQCSVGPAACKSIQSGVKILEKTFG